jgi:hypothetical protein
VAAYANLFAVGDTALQAAGPICVANEFFGLVVVADFVMNLGTGEGTGFQPAPIATALTA